MVKPIIDMSSNKRKTIASDSSDESNSSGGGILSTDVIRNGDNNNIRHDISTSSTTKTTEVTYVEFYSGVGGWTMALQDAFNRFGAATNETKKNCQLKRLAALDHSDLCTKVFQHNFGGSSSCGSSCSNKTFSIEQLTLNQVEMWHADICVMSPPCQPHTRQHTNQDQDLHDPRSASFLHICSLLHNMKQEYLPKLLFLENVIGFETSHTFQHWQEVLNKRGYHVGHFHLTPPQVGLPNDRPRYYCVAVLNPIVAASSSSSASSSKSDLRRSLKSYLIESSTSGCDDSSTTTITTDNNVNDGSSSTPKIWNSIPELNVHPHHPETVGDTSSTGTSLLPTLSSIISGTTPPKEENKMDDSLRIPEKVLKNNSAWCFDIVCPHDRRSSCFTQSYGRYIRGTGSILYDVRNGGIDNNGQTTILPELKLRTPEDREFDEDWSKGLDTSKLRYFSGMELTQLFGFDDGFTFPPDISMKQQWKLIGNSLNVGIASRVVELGLWLTSLMLVPPENDNNEKEEEDHDNDNETATSGSDVKKRAIQTMIVQGGNHDF